MFDFQFTEPELSLLTQVMFSDKISFPNAMSKHVVSIQEKLQPVIDKLVAEEKTKSETPTSE